MEKNRKMIVFLSHNIADEQRKELLERFNITDIIFLSPEHQKMWTDVRLGENYEKNKKILIDYMKETLEEGDYVLAQGNWSYVFDVVTEAKKNNIIPIYGFSNRDVKEEEVNGEVIKMSKYNHIMYVEY